MHKLVFLDRTHFSLFSCLLDSCRRLGGHKVKPKKLHRISSKKKFQPGVMFAVGRKRDAKSLLFNTGEGGGGGEKCT